MLIKPQPNVWTLLKNKTMEYRDIKQDSSKEKRT